MVWGLEFETWDPGSWFMGLGFKITGLGLSVQDERFKACGLGFERLNLEIRVSGSGFRV